MDKLDYFQRDASSAMGQSDYRIQTDRLIASAAVKRDPSGRTFVSYEEKNAADILNVFRARMELHLKLYQHRVVNIIERMIKDALAAAKDVKIVRGTPRRADGSDAAYTLLEACDDVEAYVQLGDWIINAIEASPDDGFRRARAIVRRLRERDLYPQVGAPMESKQADAGQQMEADDVKTKILEECARLGAPLRTPSHPAAAAAATAAGETEEAEGGLTRDEVGINEVIVLRTDINHGKGPVDKKIGYPLRDMLFHNPKLPPESAPRLIREGEFAAMQLPQRWGQSHFWVYSRTHGKVEVLERAWASVSARLAREAKAQTVHPVQNLSPGPTGHQRQHRALSTPNGGDGGSAADTDARRALKFGPST